MMLPSWNNMGQLLCTTTTSAVCHSMWPAVPSCLFRQTMMSQCAWMIREQSRQLSEPMPSQPKWSLQYSDVLSCCVTSQLTMKLERRWRTVSKFKMTFKDNTLKLRKHQTIEPNQSMKPENNLLSGCSPCRTDITHTKKWVQKRA